MDPLEIAVITLGILCIIGIAAYWEEMRYFDENDDF